MRRSTPGEIGLVAPPCFDNSQIEVEYDPQYTVGNAGEDFLCWGQKSCAGASLLRKFTIAYRSEAIDVSQGGPGAAFSIALYTHTTGFGRPGTQVYRGTFTGMPSYGAPASPEVVYEVDGMPIGVPMVFFTVDFGTEPLPLADGRFGWSFLQMDGDTGPVLVVAPKLQLGTVDALDIYSPGPAVPATYVGTFNFGGSPKANMWIQLDEIAVDELASSSVLNGSNVNPVLLHELFPARIGHNWAVWIDARVPIIHAAPYTILYTSRAAAAPIASRFGEILIDPAQRLMKPILGEAGYSFAIPAQVGLVGHEFFAQAAVLPPAAPTTKLTNALSVRIGY